MEEVDHEYEHFVWKRNQYANIIQCISKSSLYTVSTPRPQIFSFPADIISQILYQKRSPYLLLKLYKSCKYFFKKFKVLPTLSTCRCSDTWVFEVQGNKKPEYNMTQSILFWFCDLLVLSRTCSSVIQRIYGCTNLKQLKLSCVVISFNEFLHLISNSKAIEVFYFNDADIICTNDKTVPLNIILQCLPYCRNLNYLNKNENFSRDTIAALTQLQFKNKFDRFILNLVEVGDTFEIIDADKPCSG